MLCSVLYVYPGGVLPHSLGGGVPPLQKILTLIMETNVEKYTLIMEFFVQKTPFLWTFCYVERPADCYKYNL